MTLLGKLAVKLEAESAQFVRELDKAKKELENVSKTAKSVGLVSGVAFAAGSVAVGKFVMAASDAAEQMNVTQTSFKDLTPVIEEWASVTAEASNRSQQTMLDFAGSTQAMLAPMVGSTEAAAAMSTRVAQLAVDIGSFNNVADDEALISLKSALVGQSEPMRKFGVVLTEASLNAFALQEGIGKTTKQMSEAEKVMLRYKFILENTKLQQGDAAKTADSFANQIKGIQGASKDVAVDLGKNLLPVFESIAGKVLSVLRGFRNLSPEVKRFASFALLGGTAAAGMAAALSAVAFALPGVIAGFGLMKAGIAAALAPAKKFAVIVGGIAAGLGAVKMAFRGNLFGMADALDSFVKGAAKVWGGLVKGMIEAFKDAQRLVTLGFELMKNIFEGRGIRESFSRASATARAAGKSGTTSSALEDFLTKDLSVIGALKDSFAALGPEVEETTSTQDDLQKKLDEVMAKLDKAAAGHKLVADNSKEAAKALEDLSKASVSMASSVLDANRTARETAMKAASGAGFDLREFQGAQLAGPAGMPSAAVRLPGKLKASAGELAKNLNDGVKSIGDNVMDFAKNLGERLGRSLGPIGSAFSTAAGGDIQGALTNLAFSALQNSEAFKRMQERLKQVMSSLTKAIEPVMEALEPIVDVFSNLAESIIGGLQPAFDALAKVAQVVAAAFGAIQSVGGAIKNALSGPALSSLTLDELKSEMQRLQSAYGPGGGVASSLISTIAAEIQRRENDPLGEALRGLTDEQISQAFDNMVEPLRHLESTTEDAASNMEDLNDSMKKATESLLNVPQGFKVAAARFQAIQAGFGPNDAGLAGAGGASGVTVNGNIVVVSNDVDDMLEQIRIKTGRQAVADGDTEASGLGFSARLAYGGV